MKANRLLITFFAAVSLFAYSCSNNNSPKEEPIHSESDGHNHTTVMVKTTEQSVAGYRNDKGELVDARGEVIVGCPAHKDMIGSEGDLCPKCNYMKMVPITWDISGVDTVRVTTLPGYHSPIK